ncbi:hypothetical protein [Streptomyces sp. SP18CS02]|uniref:hypothetical protein n=1 Tax=Streptomyces sp. SP18CS02 TaxID=3002531 RepID=UPI002E793C6A|nr:hypothetical protein [Streptomyces sp. SP18CS02]MEE1750989.1 hypothetical protein [Streptomyces sp. SP18CS02]
MTTTMSRGVFDDVPLTTLFPGLSATDVASVRQTARAIDAARADGNQSVWEWALWHVAFPGPQPGTPIVLGLDLIEHADGVDQLEFLLQVVWTDQGQLAVDVAVNVACWCETEHATHDVDALRLVVGEKTPLPQAVEAGAERLTGWLADPRDADYWRARAALPPRQP